MQRVLTFTAGVEEDDGKYALLQDAMQIGSAMLRQKKPDEFGREARRAEKRITETIRTIGVVVGDAEVKPDEFGLKVDRRKRRLGADGGEIKLEQPDFKRLCDYVEATPWMSDLSDQIAELQDWLEAAPEAKKEQAEAK